MRYLEFSDGAVALSTGTAISHSDLLRATGRRLGHVVSAGFLAGRYSATEAWEVHGRSIGLDIESNPELQVPTRLFAALHEYGQVFASDAGMLDGLNSPCEAIWGLTDEGRYGEYPVFSPMHPNVRLRATEAVAR